MIVADTWSIIPLLRRCFLRRPLSIMLWKAIFDVKRSSTRATSLSGNWLRNSATNGSIYCIDSDGVLSMCFASPTTKRSTASRAQYSFM